MNPIMLNQITIGDIKLLVLDKAPAQGNGMEAEIGALAVVQGEAGIYQKTGSSHTAWKLSSIDAAQLGLDLAALDSRLDVLETDPTTKTYVDGVKNTLEGKINQEITDRQTADTTLSGRVSALEADPVTKTYVDGADNALDARLDALELDPVTKAYVNSADNALDARLDIIEGADTVEGSVAKAEKDAKDYADGLISAEQLARSSADTTLDGKISQEISNRQAGDAATLASAKAYTDSLDDVKFHDNLATFPATGSDGVVYLAKDSEKLYRWKSVTIPGSFDHIVGPTGSFATLQSALASASVLDGQSIQIQAGTYSVSSVINVSKKVKIFGVDKDTVIFETAGAGSDPVNMFNVSVDDVVMANMTIKHKKTTNTTVEAAVNVSGPGFPQTRVANFIMDNCRVEHVEFGVVIRGSNWKIANSQFAYAGPSNSTRRHVGIYGILGTCFAVNNQSIDNGATGNTRWFAITSTTGTNPNETLEGKLILDGNVQQTGALQQFLSQDAWQGSAGSFEVVARNNTTNETSAFISFYGAQANFGDILASVTATGNSLSNLHGGTPVVGGKGLIGIDGSGGIAFRSSDLPVYSSGNILANLVFRSGYVEATGSTGAIAGRNESVISSASVSLSGSIPSIPTAPTTPSVGPVTTSSYSEISPEPDLSSINSSISSLQSGLSQEITNRAAGDTSTLSSAKAYADAAVLVEKTRAEGAEATLQSNINIEKGRIDSILVASDADKDSFAEIVQLINSVDLTNDNALASAVLSLQSSISTEESARIAGDAATLASSKAYTDSAVAASNIEISQVRFVAKSGNDSTGTGSMNKPFLTLAAAFSSITDATPSKRYVVRIASGSYTEASVALPANVFVIGEAKESVRITGAVSMGAWAQDNSGSDDRSGMSNVTLLSAADFNWTTAKSKAGKIYCNEVVFGSTLNLYGYNNAIAQAQFDSCVIFGALTISGINVGVFNNNSCLSNVTLNQHPNGGMATILVASGGQCNGTMTLNASVNDFNRRCSLFAKNHYMEYVTVNGPSAYADMNEGSLPRSRDRITPQNGGNVVYITTKAPHVSNEINIGEPGYQYLYNFAYVHGSTNTDLYVVSMGSAYSADNAGRSIFIESDTYGLAANVNGGDINLTTAETSGTGVRGKIKLNAKEIDVSSKKITNLANGSDAADAVNKSQLDSVETGLDARLDTIEGSGAGSIVKALNDAKSYADSAVASEAAIRLGADNALDSRLDVLETDPVTKTYVNTQDSATLSSANSYTDGKVAALVNSAPTVLDTLKELADALGSDPNFATTIAGQIGTVDSKVNQEITDRTNADLTLVKLDGSRSMTGDLNLGAHKVKNVSSLGIGTASPSTVFEMVDNNVKHSFRGTSTETSGAVNAVVASLTPAANSVELVKVMVTGLDAESNDSVTYERTVRVKNNDGTVSLGTIQSDYTSEDSGLSGANCTFIVNSSDIDVRVTGVTAKTITWKCLVRRMA